MRIKLDENLPEALLYELATLGHEVDNTRLEGIAGKPDPDVWRAAQDGGRFLITQDLDWLASRVRRGGLVARNAREGANRTRRDAVVRPESPHRCLINSVVPRPSVWRYCMCDPRCLSGHEHKYDDVRCTPFGLGRGATREHVMDL